MPTLSVWMLRSSLLALVAGSTLGALRLGDLLPMGAHAGQWRAAHLDLMLFGWLVQFVLAVGYWILPRHAEGPDRGPKWLAWSAAGAFQAGLVLAVAPAFTPGAATLAARVLLVTGALVLAGLLYPRVRPFAGE
jgi:hypothetical protein